MISVEASSPENSSIPTEAFQARSLNLLHSTSSSAYDSEERCTQASPFFGNGGAAAVVNDSAPLKYTPLELDGEGNQIIVSSRWARLRSLCCESSNARTLLVLLVFNTSFAVAQVVAAGVANSLSMYGDSATMMLDSLTYAVNIYAECKKSPNEAASLRVELIATCFSIATLVAVTGFLMWDAASRLRSGNRGQGVQVDIMLEFSMANLVIDVVACVVFLSRITRERMEQAGRRVGIAEHVQMEQEFEDSGLNMCSAFVHLLADTLRTITVLTSSIVVEEIAEVSSFKADAVSSLVVSTIILAASLFLTFETIQQFKRYKRLQS